MTPELQARIAAIKKECEEILRLDKLATAGPWASVRISGDWGFPYQMIIRTPKEDPSICGYGITLQYGGVISCAGPSDRRNERSRVDAEFIAHSRNVSPAMARVVLMVIEDGITTGDMFFIEEIANQWEGK